MAVQLPCSEDAEKAVLGSYLIDPEAIRKTRLEADDFYFVRNKSVFSAMVHLSLLHKPIDFITLSQELKADKDVTESYLMSLISESPTSLHVDTYAEIVKDKARRRKIIAIANDLVRAGYDGKDIDEVVASAASRLVSANQRQEGAVHINTVLSELYDQICEAIDNPRDIFGIETGLAGFDKITAGLQKGEVFIISGEPGVGKSFLAMQLGVGMASQHNGKPGSPGVLYELEMKGIAVLRRSLSVASKVRTRLIRSGRISESELARLTEAVEVMGELPIYISDRTDWTTTQLRADLASLKSKGIEWCVIDYLRLLKDQAANETEKYGIVSDRIHAIAKDLDIAVIGIADMTKGGQMAEKKSQANLAGDRGVGYNADMTAYLLKTETDGMFNLSWQKFREDSPDRIMRLRQVPGFPAFAEIVGEK